MMMVLPIPKSFGENHSLTSLSLISNMEDGKLAIGGEWISCYHGDSSQEETYRWQLYVDMKTKLSRCHFELVKTF